MDVSINKKVTLKEMFQTLKEIVGSKKVKIIDKRVEERLREVYQVEREIGAEKRIQQLREEKENHELKKSGLNYKQADTFEISPNKQHSTEFHENNEYNIEKEQTIDEDERI